MTSTRSDSARASAWSWVTYMAAIPSARCRRWISARVRSRSLASRLLSGSSSSMASGDCTMARATATRCCWPPDSSDDLRSPRVAQADEPQHLADPAGNLDLSQLADLQREGDVLEHGQMRPDGIGLEHHADVALVRRHRHALRRIEHDAAADLDVPRIGGLEAGDAPQRRRLAAARGAEQADELAVGGNEAHVVDDELVAEALAEPIDLDAHVRFRSSQAARNTWRETNAMTATMMRVETTDSALALPQLAFSKKVQIEIEITAVFEV